MKRSIYLFPGLTLVMLVMTGVLHAQTLTDQVGQTIADGTANVSTRLRHETVEQDNALKDAAATTLRTRLSLRTGTLNGFSALLELDNIATIGSDHYDSFVLDKYRGSYSVIADPVGSEVNQALINYVPSEGKALILGRQRINHAAQRFVGGVAWRQNEQTFDAVSYTQRSASFDFDYNYLWNVNRIFGSSRSSMQLANLDSNSHSLLAAYKAEWGTLSGYLYALDFEDAAALSSLTWGLSYTGKIGPVTINAAAALQTDHGDNPGAFDTDYYSVDAAYTAGPLTLQLGYELLGSDDGLFGFQTPLATLHKWQGWTDLFLSTPTAGIEDVFLTISGKAGNLSLGVTYHDFAADAGSVDYGDEWDLIATWPFNNRISAELKYATYERDSFAVDTDKLWLSLILAF